jgi:protein gp37
MTTIEWTDKSWNPLLGCSRVSPGCQNCYAERMAARFSGPGLPYEGLAQMTEHGPRWTGAIRLLPEELDKPLRWKKPRRVFVNSMSDLFHEKVPDEYLDRVFAWMAIAQRHTFQVLTKRAERMHTYLSDPLTADRVLAIVESLGRARVDFWNHVRNQYLTWPIPNVWLGVSVENQEYADKRIPHLLRVPAAVRFLSCEPLLGPLDLTDICVAGTRESRDFANALDLEEWDEEAAREEFGEHFLPPLDWVIAGAESGPGARHMNEDWVRDLRDQCQASGVAFFYKQRLDERGHKVSLPELDGRTWTEMPAPRGS